MERILLLAVICIVIRAEAQPPVKTTRVTKTNAAASPPGTTTPKTSIQKVESGFSPSFSRMRLRLPFAKTEKEYVVQKVGHFFVLNGDIIVGNDFPKTMLYSSDDHDYRWPNAVIPYVVDKSIYDAGLDKAVFEAIAEFNQRTTLCLKQRYYQDDYVKIVFSGNIPGAGLSSVGRQEGEQLLFLASSADKGTVMHELMHAAGFYHEQSREDRDKFIVIVEDNIRGGAENNFQVEEGIARSAYDYCSIMHYSSTAFSKNKQPTIACIQNGKMVPCPPCMGNRTGFTDSDIYGIGWFYSNTGGSPCSPRPEDLPFNPFPNKFPSIYPSASASAIAAFIHRGGLAANEGFYTAFPNFHEVRKGNNIVGGTIFIRHGFAAWKDVPVAELGNPPQNDFAERMRATQVYATRNGFIGGFPTFHHQVYNGVTVNGTVLLPSAAAEWRDVPLTELGNPPLDDIGARMRSANDYAFRNGFLGGFPTFFHANYGRGIVCGIVLIRKSAGEWKDVVVVQGPR